MTARKAKQSKPPKVPVCGSALEEQFLLYWKLFAPEMPHPTLQAKLIKTRRWQYDFTWEREKVIVEIEGGTWIAGRHSRGKGYLNDCDKQNAVMMLGYRLFKFTTDHINNDPHSAILMIKTALGRN